MIESKEVYGLTLYKCPYIKNTWLTEGSCIQQQNKVRKELLENYPGLRYMQKCINCKEGIERAKRLGAKLIGVEHLFKEKKKVKREPNYKKSVCSMKFKYIFCRIL